MLIFKHLAGTLQLQQARSLHCLLQKGTMANLLTDTVYLVAPNSHNIEWCYSLRCDNRALNTQVL